MPLILTIQPSLSIGLHHDAVHLHLVLKVGMLAWLVGLQFDGVILLGEGAVGGKVDGSESSRTQELLELVVVGLADVS